MEQTRVPTTEISTTQESPLRREKLTQGADFDGIRQEQAAIKKGFLEVTNKVDLPPTTAEALWKGTGRPDTLVSIGNVEFHYCSHIHHRRRGLLLSPTSPSVSAETARDVVYKVDDLIKACASAQGSAHIAASYSKSKRHRGDIDVILRLDGPGNEYLTSMKFHGTPEQLKALFGSAPDAAFSKSVLANLAQMEETSFKAASPTSDRYARTVIAQKEPDHAAEEAKHGAVAEGAVTVDSISERFAALSGKSALLKRFVESVRSLPEAIAAAKTENAGTLSIDAAYLTRSGERIIDAINNPNNSTGLRATPVLNAKGELERIVLDISKSQ